MDVAPQMHTVSDLRKLPLATLDTMLGTTAAELVYQLCRGVDNSEVVPFEAPKTISDEDSFKRCVCACRAHAYALSVPVCASCLLKLPR